MKHNSTFDHMIFLYMTKILNLSYYIFAKANISRFTDFVGHYDYYE
jgi:hypothetical protein